MRRVLVTGAGGKTGAAVLAALADTGARTVALVRSASHPSDVAHERVVGDQRDVDVLARAMTGVDAMYAIAPNLSPDEVAMTRAALQACGRSGVRRFVLHSVVHPQLRAMPHHADKGRAEELVIESGLDWTILQPNAYLQNLAAYVPGMRAGLLRVPYALDRGHALVDLRDVAVVAASLLLDDVGVHATLELSGPRSCTMLDVAAEASRILGHAVAAERVDPDRHVAGLPQLDPERRSRLLAMLRHYDLHGTPGDATVLRALLGREPGGLGEVLGVLLAAASHGGAPMAAPDR
jgi:NAD(P)H dehydrogenase (quinone)